MLGLQACDENPPAAPARHSDASSVPSRAPGGCGNCVLEIQTCETSLSPFSNEFPDRQLLSHF